MKRIIQTSMFLILALLLPATAQNHVANGIHHIKGPLTPTAIHNSHAVQPKVMMSPTLTQQLTAPAMKGMQKQVEADRSLMQQAFNSANNKLMNKSPRRLSANDVTGDKIVFALQNEFGKPSSSNYMVGGHSATVTEVSPGVLSVYFIYRSYYAIPVSTTINVDYNTNNAELVVGTVASFQWSNIVGNTTYDTAQYVMVLNEDYLLNYPNGNPTNIPGTINDNGSLHFDDSFCYYIIDYCTKTTNNGVTHDTIAFISNTYRDTYLMTPNGKHQYDSQNENGIDTVYTEENDVYMYQADDTTAVIWNMWGLGNRGMMMYIHEDGKMEFPSLQTAYTVDPSIALFEDDEFIYSDECYNYAVELPSGANYIDFGQISAESSFGTVTPTEITWGANIMVGYARPIGEDTWHPATYLIPYYLHNKLTFTDGSLWVLQHEDPVEDGLYYRYEENGEAIVIAGEIPYSGDIVIPETTVHDGRAYTVTVIGDSAFYNCTELTSVVIGDSVTSIGSYAFNGCTGMTSVSIGNSVNFIGYKAFNECTGLTRVNITDLEAWCKISYGYGGQGNLTSSYSNPCYSSHHLFLNNSEITNLIIPESITSINNDAFVGCQSMTSVTFPNSVIKIGNCAFENCTGITNIYLPNSLTRIGNYAFNGCPNLMSIDIPNSVNYIGWFAFNGCAGLTSIEIPESVTFIGNSAFGICPNLSIITVASDNPNYDSRNNCNAIIESSSNTLITGCMNTVIPNSVTSIGRYAFNSCANLTNIDLPNSITSIGYAAFISCNGLTSITIPNSVTTIEDYAFERCDSLSTISIGAAVTSIGNRAFYIYRSKVTSVTCYASNPPEMGNNDCFSNYYSTATLYVPEESIELYRNTDWWNRFVNIEALAQTGDVNGDGLVNTGDISALINLLLGGGDLPDSADCNHDGNKNVGDVPALINYLLSGSWN